MGGAGKQGEMADSKLDALDQENLLDEQLARRLRLIRKDKHLTLKYVAERVGCSKSYISQVENGAVTPSLSMLGKLAQALDVPVAELFMESPESEDALDWVVPQEHRRTINYPDGKVQSHILVNRVYSRKMEPVLTEIEPGGTSDFADQMEHPFPTEEFVLVLEGEITFSINGRKYHLKEGDSGSFNGSMPHCWTNEGQKVARVLFVWTPPIW